MSFKKPIIALIILSVISYFVVQHEREETALKTTIYGNVDIRETQLSFRVPGRLKSVNLDEGDIIKAGDLVATIDAQPYQDAVQIAQAQVAVSEASLANLEDGARRQEISRAKQESQVLKAAKNNTHIALKRQITLLRTNSTSQAQVDLAQARYDEASAALAASLQTVKLLESGPRKGDIATAKANIQVQRAALTSAQTKLADTQLFSPSSGVVLSRILEPGTMVGSGTPVITLSLQEPTYIRAYVPEPMLGKITAGQQVKVYTDSRAMPYIGKVGFISPRAEFTPKSVQTESLRTDLVYRIRVVVKGQQQGLNQGMPVSVELQ